MVRMDRKPSMWPIGRLRMVAHINSSKGVKYDVEYVRVFWQRVFRSSISSFGRQKSSEDGERRYFNTLTGSGVAFAPLRAERRGALFGRVLVSALRFLEDVPSSLLFVARSLLCCFFVESCACSDEGTFASACLWASEPLILDFLGRHR